MNVLRHPVLQGDDGCQVTPAKGERPTGFGALLRALRLGAGLSQEGLAERARLSVVTIGALEAGSPERALSGDVGEADAGPRARYRGGGLARGRGTRLPPAEALPRTHGRAGRGVARVVVGSATCLRGAGRICVGHRTQIDASVALKTALSLLMPNWPDARPDHRLRTFPPRQSVAANVKSLLCARQTK